LVFLGTVETVLARKLAHDRVAPHRQARPEIGALRVYRPLARADGNVVVFKSSFEITTTALFSLYSLHLNVDAQRRAAVGIGLARDAL
jgi:hypothetical protein